MPLYDYECAVCGAFEAMCSMAQRDATAYCPECGSVAARVVSLPAYSLMEASARTAHATNERARHEPKRASAHVHGPGCGCSNTTSNKTTVKAADGSKAFPSKRPWMISH
jgi:putative FmdB family regulatory protein